MRDGACVANVSLQHVTERDRLTGPGRCCRYYVTRTEAPRVFDLLIENDLIRPQLRHALDSFALEKRRPLLARCVDPPVLNSREDHLRS